MAESKGTVQQTMDELKLLFGDDITQEELEVLTVLVALPTVNARVDRKINMGNYESLGIGVSVNHPIFLPERLKPIYERLESEGLKGAYNLAAVEMNKRVDRIKARAKAEDSD